MNIPYITKPNLSELVNQEITIVERKWKKTGKVKTPNNYDFIFSYQEHIGKEIKICSITLYDGDITYMWKNKYKLNNGPKCATIGFCY